RGGAPAAQVGVGQQQVLGDGGGGVVGAVAGQLQGHQGVAGGIDRAALAPPLEVVVAVARQELGDEVGLLRQVLVTRHVQAAGAGGGQGEDRQGLVVAGEAGALGGVPLGGLEQ